MKKSLFFQKRFERLAKKDETREYWVWECVRRNKDYIKDFKKYRRKKLNGNLRDVMFEKWHLWNYLPNPEEPLQVKKSHTDYPTPYSPVSHTIIGMDEFVLKIVSEKERTHQIFHAGTEMNESVSGRIELFKPGSVLKREGQIVREFQEWAIFNYDEGTYEALNQDNCPRFITITVVIEPYFQKGDIKELLQAEFEKAYEKVSAAQRKVLSKSTRPRFDEFKKYMQAWDLRQEGKKWFEIAKEVLPEYFEGSKQEPVGARDLVRFYYKQAEKMINGGWKRI